MLNQCITYVQHAENWWQENPEKYHPMQVNRGFQRRVRDFLNSCIANNLTFETLRAGFSFVELLGIPTEGSSTGFRELYGAFLFSQENRKHLKAVRRWITQNKSPLIIIPKGVLELMAAMPAAIGHRQPTFFGPQIWDLALGACDHFTTTPEDHYHDGNFLVPRKFPYGDGQDFDALAGIVRAAFQ